MRDGVSPLLSFEDIVKAYGPVKANDGVSVDFHAGEIHAILGENGAGKSTLIKIAAGMIRPDSGAIRFLGDVVALESPQESRALGIGVVHQRIELVPRLTVLENIALQEVGLGRVPFDQLAERSQATAERLGFDASMLRARVDSLTIGSRQRVELIRSLLSPRRIVFLDEPTSILAPPEADRLYELLHDLADSGVAVVLVTHRLREAADHADRVTVMRRGRVVRRIEDEELDTGDVVRTMVGGSIEGIEIERREAPDDSTLVSDATSGEEVVLRMEGVTGESPSGRRLEEISLAVRRGQIFGVAGVEGNGQVELVDAAIGRWTPSDGQVELLGRSIDAYPPERRTKIVADVPEELSDGLLLNAPVRENAILQELIWGAGPGWWAQGRLDSLASQTVESFDVRTHSLAAPVRTLSGGNQRRLLVGRELSRDPDLVVALHATKGLDVMSALHVQTTIKDLARRGAAILYVSADLEEILAISDVIGVLYHGHIVATLHREHATPELLGALMVSGQSDTADPPDVREIS